MKKSTLRKILAAEGLTKVSLDRTLRYDVGVFDSYRGSPSNRPKQVVASRLSASQVKAWGRKAWKAWRDQDLGAFVRMGVDTGRARNWEDFADNGTMFIAFPTGDASRLDDVPFWSWTGPGWNQRSS